MLVAALPLTVVVTTLVAVVEAWHPVQVVQGALVPQGPLVHPDQVEAGHALPPHQLVQGAAVHEPDDAQGPQPELFPLLPNGPTPDPPAHPPWLPPGPYDDVPLLPLPPKKGKLDGAAPEAVMSEEADCQYEDAALA